MTRPRWLFWRSEAGYAKPRSADATAGRKAGTGMARSGVSIATTSGLSNNRLGGPVTAPAGRG